MPVSDNMDAKECCRNSGNLQILPEDQKEEHPSLTVYRCSVCDCRHLVLVADKGKLGVKGAAVG